jgi:hypothetical protein
MTESDDAISNRVSENLICDGLLGSQDFQRLECSYKIQYGSRRSHSFELHAME